MVVTDRYYPYPVLGGKAAAFSDGCKFDATCEVGIISRNLMIRICVSLVEPELQLRLENKDVRLVAHIECPSTALREVRDLTLGGVNEIVYKQGCVAGELQVCVFIVAAKALTGYTSSSFVGFYKGRVFDIEAGGRLAATPHFRFVIQMRNKRLSNSQSLIVYCPNPDEQVNYIEVDTNDQQIVILLPPNLIGLVKVLNEDVRSISAQSSKNYLLIRAMVMVPALVEVFGRLSRVDFSEGRRVLSEYEDAKWFAYLNKCVGDFMAKHGDEQHNQDDLYTIDYGLYSPLKIAQYIAGNPIVPVFDKLKEL